MHFNRRCSRGIRLLINNQSIINLHWEGREGGGDGSE
jgi:hypothetical protein